MVVRKILNCGLSTLPTKHVKVQSVCVMFGKKSIADSLIKYISCEFRFLRDDCYRTPQTCRCLLFYASVALRDSNMDVCAEAHTTQPHAMQFNFQLKFVIEAIEHFQILIQLTLVFGDTFLEKIHYP